MMATPDDAIVMPPPPEEGVREVDSLYAWIVRDTLGNESIASVHIDETPVQLVNADDRRLRRFIPAVRKAARELGAPAVLVRFVREEVLYEAEPL